MKMHIASLEISELDQLTKTIAYITLLIAAADGDIDIEEIEAAEHLSHVRSYNEPIELLDFFDIAEKRLIGHIQDILPSLPEDSATRLEYLSMEISKVNAILKKLENEIAFKLYQSFLALAKYVSQAEGGFLNFGTINNQERILLHLPMISKVERKEI